MIARMLTRMVLLRFLIVLGGISIFVLTLDIVTYAKDIVQIDSGGLASIGRYGLYRAPSILATFLAISVLLALLLTLTELSYRNEMPAIWSAGVSPLRLMLMLLPLGLGLGALHFALSDRAIPWAAPQLRDWGIGDYGEKKLTVGEKDPIWMRAGPDILRAASGNRQASELSDVIVFRRNADGLLQEQIIAARAVQSGGRWTLHDVVVYYQQNLPPDRLKTLIYSGAMKPASAGARSGDPEEMTSSGLSYFIDNAGFGIRPAWVYTTWWHKRMSLFFSAIVMIAICVPLAMRFRRGGGIGALFGAGIGLGFVFFVTDGISLTMGELGFVLPWLAAWGPVLAFAAIAAAIGFRTLRI